MTSKWLDIIAQGQDANLGAALIRLARQAETVHRFEAARGMAAGAMGRTDRMPEQDERPEASARTEVDR